MFHEYPKALYRDGVYMAVNDAAEESAQRADGWTGFAEDYAKQYALDGGPPTDEPPAEPNMPQPRRGRTVKVG